jgi:membrane associated rhomboid family serine protease
MPSIDRLLVTDVLRACYDAAPAPLYPAPFAQARGLDRAALDRLLDELRLKGLVRLTEWVQGQGQGYTLTPAGVNLLDNLQPGQSVRENQAALQPQARAADDWPGERPKRRPALIRPGKPVVTYTLIGVNVFLFLFGMFLADRAGISNKDYLEGDQTRGVQLILYQLGSLSAEQGVPPPRDWWRIIACAFLHLGILHIGLNMYALYVLGPLLEAMWGSGRLLLLYFVSAITASSLVIWTGSNVVGASGAICGLLGSLGVWVMLNRDHLPPELAAGLSRMVMINLVILAFISFMSGISWQGHLGGALGGAIASFPLQISRYSDSIGQRILGFAGTVLVAIAFLLFAFSRGWGVG